jgi:hypothetical protein
MAAPIYNPRKSKPSSKHVFRPRARSISRCRTPLNTPTLARLWTSTLIGAMSIATALDVGPASWASLALLRVLGLLAVKACNRLGSTVMEVRS